MKEAPFQLVFAVIKAVWRFIGDVAASAEVQEDQPTLLGGMNGIRIAIVYRRG